MLSRRTVGASVVVPPTPATPLATGLANTAAAATSSELIIAFAAAVGAGFGLIAATELLRRFRWRRRAKKLQEELNQMDPLLQALKDPGAASTVDAFKRVVQNAILAQRSLRTELDLVQGLRPEPPIGAAPDAPKGETGPFVLDAPATTPLQTARPSIIEVAHAVTPSETDRLAVEALLVAIEVRFGIIPPTT